MDERINFTIPLRGLEHLSPTVKNVLNKFSVKYFIKLGILCNEESWSKPIEIILYK